ncbi:MAG: VWA domain-containing protein [Vicinamibacterales bacterium]
MHRIAGLAALLVAAAAGVSSEEQEQPKPTFSVAVTLVTTDVIVRDGKGQFVADLQKDDFEVFEDGQKQDVSSFVLVHGGRSFSIAAPAPAAAPEGIVLPGSRPAADEAGRVLLIFVDDAHLEALSSHHVRALLEKVATTLVHDGDLVSLVTTGTSSVSVPLTYDRKLIDAAIEKIAGNGLTFLDITQLSEGPSGPANLRQRAANSFATAYQTINELERVKNKRKAMIWVSQGYDFNPFEGARRGKDRVFGGRYGSPTRDMIRDEENPFFRSANVFAEVDLFAQLREITRAANRANATLFTVDPRGLVGTTDAGQQIDQDEWITHIQKTHGSMRTLADDTGGFAVLNTNDFDAALKRIDAETSDYYVLGFYSSNRDPGKRVRELEVKVRRPDVTVFSRRFYSLRPAQPRPTSQ